jgi:hypothetical protein
LKHYIKTVSQITLTSISTLTAGAILVGCESKQDAQNFFMIIQQEANGSYSVIEKHPTDGPSRAIIRDKNGNERLMSNEEMTQLAKQEAQRFQDNSSNINHNQGGMSMGEAILAAATGAVLGNLIGNSLANKINNNPRFKEAQRQSANKTSAYSRSAKSSTSKTGRKKSRSGFFGRSNRSRSSFGRGFFGG